MKNIFSLIQALSCCKRSEKLEKIFYTMDVLLIIVIILVSSVFITYFIFQIVKIRQHNKMILLENLKEILNNHEMKLNESINVEYKYNNNNSISLKYELNVKDN